MLRNLTPQVKLLLLIGLTFFVWWTAPIFLRATLRSAFNEFHAPAWSALSYLRDVRQYWAVHANSKPDLIAAGIDLARLNAAYALQNQRAASNEAELQRLEQFLNLPPLPAFEYTVARVIQRDISTWWHAFQIRKGSRHGIAVGQGVVFAGGVVGRISSVQAYTASVELLSSPSFRMAANIKGDLRPVEFRGSQNSAFQPALGRVLNAPADATTDPADPKTLISSRLGGIFPDGLAIGTILSLQPNEDGLFQTGPVRIDPRLHSLREVAVLIPVTSQMPSDD